MPVEAKPLFRPDALRPHLKTFQLPKPVEEYRAILPKWADMLVSGKADRFKEREILGDFLADVFCSVLGYTRPADDPDRHTMSREKHVQADGKFADFRRCGDDSADHRGFQQATAGWIDEAVQVADRGKSAGKPLGCDCWRSFIQSRLP